MNRILKRATIVIFVTASIANAKENKKMNQTNLDQPKMKVMTPKDMPSQKGPTETFTGTVKVTSLFNGEDPSNLTCACVGFESGARSAWHTHPRGQLLVVTGGSGLIQEWGKPVRRIQKGDVIWTPPNVKHWHGASPNAAMTHIATQEALNGKVVEWMEKVTDEEYGSADRE